MGVSVIKSGKVYGTANYLLGVAFCSKQVRVGRAKLLELENQNKNLGLNTKEISVFAGKKTK